MADRRAGPDAGAMRHHPRPAAVVALAVLALVLLAGCGGSDGSDGSSGSSGGSSASTGAEPAADDDGEDAAGGGERADLPGSGLSFADALNADGLTPEQSSELQITLSVLGLDHPGYVAGSTIVAVTSDDDPEDRQFTCIAAGQVDQDQYEVVVVDDAGEVLDC